MYREHGGLDLLTRLYQPETSFCFMTPQQYMHWLVTIESPKIPSEWPKVFKKKIAFKTLYSVLID